MNLSQYFKMVAMLITQLNFMLKNYLLIRFYIYVTPVNHKTIYKIFNKILYLVKKKKKKN
jgi:hypothetical protein